MLSYHNDPELKARAVEAAKRHRDADVLAAGTYGDIGSDGRFLRGCSVGCDAHDITGKALADDDVHATTSKYFGFPEWLERLRDDLFEGLPKPDRYEFHVQLKEAIPVGVDLEPVRHKLAICRLEKIIDSQARNDKQDTTEVEAALEMVKRCHEAQINGNACDWRSAEVAVRTARMSATSQSAMFAAMSAERSVETAHHTGRVTTSVAYKQERDDLLAILRGMS